MRGRKPKPSYLVAIDGKTSHSRKDNPDEPKPEGDLAEPPPELSATQQRIWRRAVGEAPPGMLKLLDRSIFVVWVVACDTFELARSEVSRLGLMVKVGGAPDDKGRIVGGQMIQNPYLSIQNKQATIMHRAASELGFSPTSRTRVKVQGGAKGKGSRPNPFGALKNLTD